MVDFDHIIAASMTALLSNEDTKTKVIQYLETQIANARPTEVWREVWWQLSSDVRRFKDMDIYTGIQHPKCKLLVYAHWNEQSQIGLIVGIPVRGDYARNQLFRGDWRYATRQDEVFRLVGAYWDYTEVIQSAQNQWGAIHQLWIDKTLEPE